LFNFDQKTHPENFILTYREEVTMIAPLIGMRFLSFLILLILSAFAAIMIHSAAHYRFLGAAEGFFGKWIVSWICAWLGPSVFGHWFGSVMLWNVYIIPALIGAFVGAFLATASCRAMAGARSPRGVVQSMEEHRAA
jgi:uncharacterized membrane protein YeaQ/YmgE (transglycosylase-associated protein family)